jgi:hypothetical protein
VVIQHRHQLLVAQLLSLAEMEVQILILVTVLTLVQLLLRAEMEEMDLEEQVETDRLSIYMEVWLVQDRLLVKRVM